MKAVRGSGFSYGLAEDTGAAIAWLLTVGARGDRMLAALTAYLEEASQGEAGALAPPGFPIVSLAAQAPWCPLSLGVALLDVPAFDAQSVPLELGRTRWPIIMLLFLAQRSPAWSLELKGVDSAGLLEDWQPASLARHAAMAEALCRVVPGAGELAAAAVEPPVVVRVRDATVIRRLETLAARTYAPATELSRRLGAGADGPEDD